MKKLYANFYHGAKKVQDFCRVVGDLLTWVSNSIDRLPVPSEEAKPGKVDTESVGGRGDTSEGN